MTKHTKVMYVTSADGVPVQGPSSSISSSSASASSTSSPSKEPKRASGVDPEANPLHTQVRAHQLFDRLKLTALTVLPAFRPQHKESEEAIESRMEKGKQSPEVWDEHLEQLRERGSVHVELSCIDYSRDEVSAVEDIKSVEDPLISAGKPAWATVRWINIDGIDATIVNFLAKLHNLHPLMVGDICEIVNRPKMDFYEAEGHIFIIAKMVSLPPDSVEVDQEHVFFFYDSGTQTILTFQEGRPGDAWANVRRRIQRANSKIRLTGADYLLYTLLDGMLETCYPIVEQFGNMIEDIEFQLLREPTPELNRQVYNLKRQLLILRRSVWPMRDVVQELISEDVPDHVIKEETKPFLKDINDHLLQINDMVETYAELATGLSSLYANQQAQKMNQVMFVLTLVSAVFIPLTFVAGVYGMNFDFMPELSWKYGYLYVWAVFLSLAAGIMYAFWRKGWIGREQ